jgi:hypothetical protein
MVLQIIAAYLVICGGGAVLILSIKGMELLDRILT